MGMTLVPAAPVDGDAVVTLAEVKAFLRVEGSDEDALIASLRAAAIRWVERYTAHSLTLRDWRWSLSGFASVLRLPREPVADGAVTAITYRDAGGVEVPVADGGWIVSAGAVIAAAGRPWPVTWATDGAVTITFAAGYADVKTEAPELMTAVLLMVRHLYDRGEGETSPAVRALCDAVRVPVIG